MSVDLLLESLAPILQMLPILFLLIGLDVLSGVIAALKSGVFDIEKLPKFLADYGVKVFGWLVLEVIVRLVPEDTPGLTVLLDPLVATGVYALILASAFSSIMKNLGEMGVLGGLNVPLSRAGLGYKKPEA